MTWVPKGVIHHGPAENVPETYQAWLLERVDASLDAQGDCGLAVDGNRRLRAASEREQVRLGLGDPYHRSQNIRKFLAWDQSNALKRQLWSTATVLHGTRVRR